MQEIKCLTLKMSRGGPLDSPLYLCLLGHGAAWNVIFYFFFLIKGGNSRSQHEDTHRKMIYP